MANESRKILLAVSGGIAAYKAADLCSKLAQSGAQVRVAFSRNAEMFVTPLVFEALSGHPVYRHVFETPTSYQMEHISLARWADTMVVAPASADILARMATGQADDAITTLYLAFRGPVFVAPSMNSAMLEHPATQANLSTLQKRKVQVIAPGAGSLACGETGSGRMSEPLQILEELGIEAPKTPENDSAASGTATLMSRPADETLAEKTVLITSGPTHEYIDPVRFISNPSSGRMGLALANDAMRRGAHVLFISGPVEPRFIPRGNCEVFPVDNARQMLEKAQEHKCKADLFIFAAAVGDFRSAQSIPQKIKRSGNSITLPLVENPDIAQAIGFGKLSHQASIGFAAETNDHENNAKSKLERKHLDAIVINDVSNADIGFNSEENEVSIVLTGGEQIDVPQARKSEIAYEVLEVGRRLLDERS